MKPKITLIFIFSYAILGNAQQYNEAERIEYSQYMYNSFTVNPGMTGMEGTPNFTINYRSELLRDFNHYKRESAMFSLPSKRKNMAFGFSIINDEYDDMQHTYFDLATAYDLKLNEKSNLSFGIKVRGNLLDHRFPESNSQPLQDFYNSLVNRFVFNIGAGAVYSDDWFFVGLSVPSFLNTVHYDISELQVDTRQLPILFNTGYVFLLSNDISFMPMFYTRIQNEESTDIDISTNFLFQDKFGLNVVYRWDDHYGVFANFQILDAVMISLGYGNQTSLRTEGLAANDGIFQITLRYENILKRGGKLFTRF
ncbi:type IX secretion system membrane protein PorP/SprF [Muricauda sp. SCSIO 64092]|uniref:PorP/SprF family type IX secretion system membrane protein n=1 Tax=Allomuricauda sp. SCSIO 64092 TaxID=2908842 RepID=UPI001FF1E819|nr:type IX secretion system membrane protein PorP/SprF [Muricauda sp. SCSIO 64092]UOY06190.1 type IX secretion system membrane protein PorP/SprF [Muricauda sp. SCSIO 64092]